MTAKMRKTRALVMALLAASAFGGCKTSTSAGPAMSSDGPPASMGTGDAGAAPGGSRITGRLIAVTQRSPLSGRTVKVGARSVVSAEDGSFVLEDVPASYALTVVEPDETSVSIYTRLTRRDPVLAHAPGDADSPPAPRATIAGMVTGVTFPLDRDTEIGIHLFSRAARYAAGHVSGRLNEGPDFGPIQVSWSGSAPVEGQLVALGANWTDQGWQSATIAARPVTLADGARVSGDLALRPTSLFRLTGTVDQADGAVASGLHVRYHMPSAEGYIDLGHFLGSPRFAFAVPQLSELGGRYCVSAAGANALVSSTQCRPNAEGTDFRFQFPAPPKLLKPMDGAPVTKDTKYAWTPVANAVYVVEFEPSAVSKSAPHITVYTTDGELDWAPLAAAGIAYPAGQEYTVHVSAVGPHQDLDEASATGILALDRDGFWHATERIVVKMVQ